MITKDTKLLRRCEEAYSALSGFRATRRRCLDFTYGRQWDDLVRLPSGMDVAEGESMMLAGRMPITNNIIRRMIKSVIGRYRYLCNREEEGTEAAPLSGTLLGDGDPLEETRARALEEFLISGCAAQRVSREGDAAVVANISPARIFFNSFRRHDASDCRFIGMLHDMAPSDIVARFSGGNHEKMLELVRLLDISVQGATTDGVAGIFFDNTESFAARADGSDPDLVRVIEVWRKDWFPVINCHDPQCGEYVRDRYRRASIDALEAENVQRRAAGDAELKYFVDVCRVWEHTFLTPTGHVLHREVVDADRKPPIVVSLYPLIDGEVHSAVEDVIGHQKYVNRLVTMMDDVLGNSAKGVVLFPADQLPEGMTWKEMRSLWASPAGVLPFKRTSHHIMPMQVQSAGSCAGASEMLKLQLDLFDGISGSTEALRSASRSASGAESLKQQVENATISMLDVLAAFRAFNVRVEAVAAELSENQNNKEPSKSPEPCN